MRRFRYPARAMSADYARGLAGIALTWGPIWLLSPGNPLVWILAAGTILFLVYFVRAVVRHLTRIELSETGIEARGPFGGTIPWDELCSMRLSYYTTRSDRTGGWMQLDLGSSKRSISVDSRIESFAELAGAAAAESSRRGQPLDETTRFNLKALGVRFEGDG